MQMSPSERQRIAKYYTEQAYNLADKEHEAVQEYMIKTDCIYMHDFLGCNEEQLLHYVAWRRRMYRATDRYKTEEERKAWLDRELQRCFPNGFPQMRIDDMKSKEEVELLNEQR